MKLSTARYIFCGWIFGIVTMLTAVVIFGPECLTQRTTDVIESFPNFAFAAAESEDTMTQTIGVVEKIQKSPEKTSFKSIRVPQKVMHCNNWTERDNFVREETVPYEPFQLKTRENENERSEAFRRIFNDGIWLHETTIKESVRIDDIMRSGVGSTRHQAQRGIEILQTLIDLIKASLNITTIKLLDVPCGDMQWMPRFLRDRDDILYTGYDIVPELIEYNTKKFAENSTTMKFGVFDIVTQDLEEEFDLILCRQVLQHLHAEDASIALHRFSESGSKYLLTTSMGVPENKEIPNHDSRHREFNLLIDPINLSQPICYSQDTASKNNFLMLWDLPLRQQVRRLV